jgi:hypothetical protein
LQLISVGSLQKKMIDGMDTSHGSPEFDGSDEWNKREKKINCNSLHLLQQRHLKKCANTNESVITEKVRELRIRLKRQMMTRFNVFRAVLKLEYVTS